MTTRSEPPVTAPRRRRPRDVALFTGGPWYRRVRLTTGCILFAYVFTHLLDHASGNISLGAMEAILRAQKVIWQSAVGTVALYGSLLIHASLGIWSLYARRYVGWTALEIWQLVLGLLIPPLLANHVMVTRGALDIFGIDKAYSQELAVLWVVIPVLGIVQVTVLVVAWSHACIGLHTAFRLKRWYARARPTLLVLAVTIPMLALLGFAHAARDVERRMEDPAWVAANLPPARTGTDEQVAALFHIRTVFILGYAALIGGVLLARVQRARAETHRAGIVVRYPDGCFATIPAGLSVLDASRMLRHPHASVCGGRGRCSTCRVRLVSVAVPDGDPVRHPPTASETAILDALRVDPQTVRLACQFRPLQDVAIMPLVPPALAERYIVGRRQDGIGQERFLAAMFVDMRGSLDAIAGRLAFDAFYILGRFVDVVAVAVQQSGGQPVQFTGDGFLAFYGLEDTPERACRSALNAIPRIGAALTSSGLAAERVTASIGLHCGQVVIGEIAFMGRPMLGSFGEVVHVAARLESSTRALGCDAVVSDDVFRCAGIAWPTEKRPDFVVRGRPDPLAVQLVRIDELTQVELRA